LGVPIEIARGELTVVFHQIEDSLIDHLPINARGPPPASGMLASGATGPVSNSAVGKFGPEHRLARSVRLKRTRAPPSRPCSKSISFEISLVAPICPPLNANFAKHVAGSYTSTDLAERVSEHAACAHGDEALSWLAASAD
jgi:hypothetical protein